MLRKVWKKNYGRFLSSYSFFLPGTINIHYHTYRIVCSLKFYRTKRAKEKTVWQEKKIQCFPEAKMERNRRSGINEKLAMAKNNSKNSKSSTTCHFTESKRER